MYGFSYTFSNESLNVVTKHIGPKEIFFNCIYAIQSCPCLPTRRLGVWMRWRLPYTGCRDAPAPPYT